MSDEQEKTELEKPELEQPMNEPVEAEEPAFQAAVAEPEVTEAAPPTAAADPKAAKAASKAVAAEPEAAEAAPKATAAERKASKGAPKAAAAAEAEPEVAEAAPQAAAEPARNPNFKWYILHAYSGFERKVRESIESRVQAFGLKDRVGRVMIPTEPVTEIINGKKRTVERVFLPGYVLVEMELDNNLWHVLKDTPKVTGFLGTGDKPVALSEEEVSSILFRSETAKDKPRLKIKFEKSEQVRITDGPFANFNGVVDEINEDRETMKVMVTIFGRSTPVELEFSKVEKIE
jgi:transcriptional antiterminator NusG